MRSFPLHGEASDSAACATCNDWITGCTTSQDPKRLVSLNHDSMHKTSFDVRLKSADWCSAHKYLHVALQTASGIFILLGLIFVELFKRYNGEKHFWSVHSWLGAIAMAMYITQYTAGEQFPQHAAK